MNDPVLFGENGLQTILDACMQCIQTEPMVCCYHKMCSYKA